MSWKTIVEWVTLPVRVRYAVYMTYIRNQSHFSKSKLRLSFRNKKNERQTNKQKCTYSEQGADKRQAIPFLNKPSKDKKNR